MSKAKKITSGVVVAGAVLGIVLVGRQVFASAGCPEGTKRYRGFDGKCVTLKAVSDRDRRLSQEENARNRALEPQKKAEALAAENTAWGYLQNHYLSTGGGITPPLSTLKEIWTAVYDEPPGERVAVDDENARLRRLHANQIWGGRVAPNPTRGLAVWAQMRGDARARADFMTSLVLNNNEPRNGWKLDSASGQKLKNLTIKVPQFFETEVKLADGTTAKQYRIQYKIRHILPYDYLGVLGAWKPSGLPVPQIAIDLVNKGIQNRVLQGGGTVGAKKLDVASFAPWAGGGMSGTASGGNALLVAGALATGYLLFR